MTIIQAVILGLVQGLCEFLPVSSSGHLLLLQTIFGITEGQTFFTVMLHLGTLLAVLIVYRKTILELLKHPFQKLTGYLLLATVPTVLIAVLFKKVPLFSAFYEKAEAGTYLGICFLITSALLIAADRVRARGKRRSLFPDAAEGRADYRRHAGSGHAFRRFPFRIHHSWRAVFRSEPESRRGHFVPPFDHRDPGRRLAGDPGRDRAGSFKHSLASADHRHDRVVPDGTVRDPSDA